MSNEEVFHLVNSMLPQAQREVLIAYLTALGLLSFLLSVIAHVFAARRCAAAFLAIGSGLLAVTVPALMAKVVGSAVFILSIYTIWRDSTQPTESSS